MILDPTNHEFTVSVTDPPVLTIQANEPWPPRLAFELAMDGDLQYILDKHTLTAEQLTSYLLTPAFAREVADHRTKILAEGISFKMKAKLQAEEYLRDIDELIHDADASPAVRLDAIKSVVQWAGYVPKGDAPIGGGAGITINIAPYAAAPTFTPQVVDISARNITHE